MKYPLETPSPGADMNLPSHRYPAACLIAALFVALAAASAPAQSWKFTDVTAAAGFMYEHGYADTFYTPDARKSAGGVAAGDYDGDGWVDLFVVRGDIGPNLLFRNRGDGTFAEVGGPAGVALEGDLLCGPAFADYDGDGWLDLFVGGIESTDPKLFRNRGDGTFEDVTDNARIVLTSDTYSTTWGDYNRDGYIDFITTHWGTPHQPGHLWRNEGNGIFRSIDSFVGLTQIGPLEDDYSFTANFADINGDNWPDLLVTGDFGASRVFINKRNGSFRDATTSVITDENGMGAAVADYDNDGDLDWFVTSIWLDEPLVEYGTTGNRLYRNNGDGTFDDATDEAGVRIGYWGWGASFADFNNDGFLDIYQVNGWRDVLRVFRDQPSLLFVANGDGTFTERAAELGAEAVGEGRGIACFDYDRDGDIDIFIANHRQAPIMLRNDGGNAANYLGIKLAGAAPNTEGIGARIYVTTAGGTQMREVRSGNNYISQDPSEAHFGLGAASMVEDIRVEWPDGESTTMQDVAANQLLTIEHPGASEPPPPPEPPPAATTSRVIDISPNPFSVETAIRFEAAQPSALHIYDSAGRLVRSLTVGVTTQPQTIMWAGERWNGSPLPSGAYFVRLESAKTTEAIKVILVR